MYIPTYYFEEAFREASQGNDLEFTPQMFEWIEGVQHIANNLISVNPDLQSNPTLAYLIAMWTMERAVEQMQAKELD